MNGDEIVRPCDRHSIETELSGNMLSNKKTYENGWSNISENVRIVQLKVVEIPRFLSPKSKSKFCMMLRVRFDVEFFELTAGDQAINREVYGS